MSCRVHPVLTLVLLIIIIVAEPETTDIGGFFVDVDE